MEEKICLARVSGDLHTSVFAALYLYHIKTNILFPIANLRTKIILTSSFHLFAAHVLHVTHHMWLYWTALIFGEKYKS